MLAYTKAAGKKILHDIQKLSFACNIVTQLFYIFYLTYAVWSGTGIFYANLIMLVLSCSYFGFFLHNHNFGGKKKTAATVAKIFKWCKRLIKLFNLGIMAYGIFYTATQPDPLSIILTAVMALLWIADLALEIAVKVIKSWWDLFLEGIQADFEIISKPAGAVGNLFKRMTGKEVEEPEPPTKKRLLLDRLVEENKAEKKNKKLETKHSKSQEKLKEKERKRKEKEMKKAAKKTAKQGHTPIVADEVAAGEEEN